MSCPVCGMDFIKLNSRHIYCCRICQQKDHNTSQNRIAYEKSEKRKMARNIRNKKYRLKYISENRCMRCGTALIFGEKKTCINCHSRQRGEFQSAKDSKNITAHV
jgi:superfamily II DNA helicase RecQ